jgi:AraC family transcriptional regulator
VLRNDALKEIGMNLLEHGKVKFPVAAIEASSEGLGWQGIAAELRSHPACELAPFRSMQTEITIALRGSRNAFVARSAGGVRQRTAVNAGTIWISPEGVQEEATRINEALDDILHIYLPGELFLRMSSEEGTSIGEQSIHYEADVRDDLIRQIGVSLASEIRAPTPGGRILAESLALAMAARICQRHSSAGRVRTTDVPIRSDDARIRRVVDYMMAHLEEPIGLDELAAVACLSPFHFARTFRDEVGAPPHKFLSRLRVDHAKALLARGDRSICEIALACQFASQTNFTRAFRQVVGMTPNEYRKLS